MNVFRKCYRHYFDAYDNEIFFLSVIVIYLTITYTELPVYCFSRVSPPLFEQQNVVLLSKKIAGSTLNNLAIANATFKDGVLTPFSIMP